MDAFFKVSLLVSILWVMLQNILIVYTVVFMLRRRDLIKVPVAGMEYSQACFSGVILLATLCITNSSIQAVYDTSLSYSSQPGSWIGVTLLKYAQYFLVVLLFNFILMGMAWLLEKIFFRTTSSADDSIQNGNLPLALILSGIVFGMGLGLARVTSLILEGMTPHFVVFN